MPVTMEPIASSCVAAVGYDPRNQLLVVEFIKTGLYTYFEVSETVYKRFMSAPSKGAFVNLVFKHTNWPYQKGVVDPAITGAPLE